jgi:hypothetical protein
MHDNAAQGIYVQCRTSEERYRLHPTSTPSPHILLIFHWDG